MRSIALICAAIVLAGTAASPALAQQKTVKACQEEWRANKADNQAKGITEKAYVATCRSGGAASAPAAAPAPTRSTATPPAATPAAPAATQRTAAPPAATTTAPRQATPGAANQFTSEAQAKTHCPGDTVVWVNLQSHIYHFQNSRNFGKTKSGAFMCEKDADSAGNRAAKNEKKPS
jgi:hypothetical protein